MKSASQSPNPLEDFLRATLGELERVVEEDPRGVTVPMRLPVVPHVAQLSLFGKDSPVNGTSAPVFRLMSDS